MKTLKGHPKMQTFWAGLADYIREREIWLWAMAIAMLGRLLHHSQMVRSGHRKFWSKALWLETLTAAGMGVIGQGLCFMIGIKGGGEGAFIGILAYQGPRALDAFYALLVKRYGALIQKGGDK